MGDEPLTAEEWWDRLLAHARRDALLADDALADRIAADCHDPDHDDRWCPTCKAREAGIDDYREALAANRAADADAAAAPSGEEGGPDADRR